MPSVCKNSEKLSSSEMETPYKACVSAIEKKLRNLEKRKGKLDSYREKMDKGEKLDKDQKEAVARYETVVASLEFARELQKQFQTMSDEADKQIEKANKKQAKREKLERQQQEIERLSDILKLQAFLDSLGTDEMRSDLKSGKYGSLVLTDDVLTQLDEFYQLIAPNMDGETSFTSQLGTASEHLVSYLDRLEKPVVNTTYKDLHELVDRATDAGFFDVSANASGVPIEAAEAAPAESPESSEETAEAIKPAEVSETASVESEIRTTEASVAMMMSKSDMGESQFEMVSVSESALPPASSVQSATLGMAWYQQGSTAASLSTAAENQARSQRPLQEIVSSLQGSYNFLQDSEIDVEQSFDRMNFGVSQESSFAYMPQQVAPPSGVDLSQYPATVAATYPNGSYAATHHHQEPSFVVVGCDPTSGEMLAFPGGQSGYMPQVMPMPTSSDMSTVPQSKTTSQSLESAAKLGGGDSENVVSVSGQQNVLVQSTVHQNVQEPTTGHQGFDNSGYGAGGPGYGSRGGRGNSYGSGGYGGSRGGNSRGAPYGGGMATGGRGSAAYRGGKSR